jgi:hypothetical protein
VLIEASNPTVNGPTPVVGLAKKFAVGSRLVKLPVCTVSGRVLPEASDTRTQTSAGEETLLVAHTEVEGVGSAYVGYEIDVAAVLATTV